MWYPDDVCPDVRQDLPDLHPLFGEPGCLLPKGDDERHEEV
jgi:hypothetical protein